MSEEVTDPNDVIVTIGTQKAPENTATAGGTKGQLIISDFEWGYAQDKERKYGVGNVDAQGRTHGNREIDLSFTHIGENETLFREVRKGNFSVSLTGNDYVWEIIDVEDIDFTVSVSDGGDYEVDFEGNALSYKGRPRNSS